MPRLQGWWFGSEAGSATATLPMPCDPGLLAYPQRSTQRSEAKSPFVSTNRNAADAQHWACIAAHAGFAGVMGVAAHTLLCLSLAPPTPCTQQAEQLAARRAAASPQAAQHGIGRMGMEALKECEVRRHGSTGRGRRAGVGGVRAGVRLAGVAAQEGGGRRAGGGSASKMVRHTGVEVQEGA